LFLGIARHPHRRGLCPSLVFLAGLLIPSRRSFKRFIMLDIDAVKRVVKKRKGRGASKGGIKIYLHRLQMGAWKNYKSDIQEVIDKEK